MKSNILILTSLQELLQPRGQVSNADERKQALLTQVEEELAIARQEQIEEAAELDESDENEDESDEVPDEDDDEALVERLTEPDEAPAERVGTQQLQ